MKVPYNATIQAKQGMVFNGVLQLPPPVSLNISPGSTMQLGSGKTIAINGPLQLGGTFILNGSITVPKDAVMRETTVPIPQSAPTNSNSHDVKSDL